MLRVAVVVLVPLLLAGCAQRPDPMQTPERHPPTNAFQQFDPPAPGVANRPQLGLGGHY